MRLALSKPRTWIVVVLFIMVAAAFVSPMIGGAADQNLVPAANGSDAAAPSTGGMGDRAGVQEIVTYTVRNADGEVIEQGVSGP